MDITIRKLKKNDYDALVKISIEFQEYEKDLYPFRKGAEYGEDAVKELMEELEVEGSDIFVAELDGVAVGFINCRVEQNNCDQADTYYVEDLAVSSEHRSLGIGRKLLEYAEAFAKEKGFKKFGIGVLSANSRVLEYYKRYGFEIYGIELNKDIS